ncbi:acetyl CoA:N6-hydroxylysine acetyl transferase [Kitasatospora sp. MAP12-15]|uniref:GNAT family N-acetyltransferase n=1 Tax=unclassified Kitasatospora TaxID=2633591 RepID=UPI00247BEF43|nr:acetyl CoA:N6-hydroxylysine acetyl transferase [Kitasatospora sp. MAP12-44]
MTTVLPTAAGEFRLRPVEPADLPLITEWMNDPAVAAFWELAGPAEATERQVLAQLAEGSHSRPLLGLLDGVPMSYWEVYQAERDALAAHYPARPGDTGVHLLLGPPRYRGRGLAAVLLAALAEELLRRGSRVVAEPDVRNTASVRAFQQAGFTAAGELELPEKRALLMIRERERHRGA